jgi:stearoyl-CoA desaturase (Delta-9 desaturase)
MPVNIPDSCSPGEERISFRESLALLVMHLAALSVFFTGVSAAALIACAGMYAIRVFALTAGYHRYFSHSAFKTSRAFQFILAFAGASAAQLGPLWWAAHHRLHHQNADTEDDVHSPARRGFLWSHIGWLLCSRYARTDMRRVPDLARFPELVFIDRFSWIPPLVAGTSLLVLGEPLAAAHPGWGPSGAQFLAWGFFFSTVLVYHVTFCINSLMHMLGTRRYDTGDTSRNNLVLALLTGGEGWHNNHHRYAACARQGFRWWEIDLTYYVLLLLKQLRIIWDVREPPARVLNEPVP